MSYTESVKLRRYVRICDEGDEALQPEWEIDPKDLKLMEKVINFLFQRYPCSHCCCLSRFHLLSACWSMPNRT